MAGGRETISAKIGLPTPEDDPLSMLTISPLLCFDPVLFVAQTQPIALDLLGEVRPVEVDVVQCADAKRLYPNVSKVNPNPKRSIVLGATMRGRMPDANILPPTMWKKYRRQLS
jgi:hypothetical protein